MSSLEWSSPCSTTIVASGVYGINRRGSGRVPEMTLPH